jgi:DNA invertase Pin-like site-specific DNA recombinase
MSARHSTNGKSDRAPGDDWIDAAAYYRMSDDRQENSIERQRSQVEPYASRKRYRIVREYIDEGISGDEITRRKHFQRMLRDAQTGLFQVILCDDKDRFGRFDSIDSGEVVAPLRRKGVQLDAVANGLVDWNSFAGRITDAVLQEAKQLEQEAISRRVLTNQLLKAQQGIDTGGRVLYGYRWEYTPAGIKHLVPDGRKAEVVRLLFTMYDQGHTLYALAEELYRRAVPSPNGRSRWTRSVIQRILQNRRYVGDWTWGVHGFGKRHRYSKDGIRPTDRARRGQVRNPPAEWLVCPDHHEPLIDRDIFERVQARLAGNRSWTTPHVNGGSLVLSRLLVCGHCGAYLVGVTDHGHRQYVCGGYLAYGKGHCRRNRVPEDGMVRVIVRKLREAFLDPENLQRLRQEMRALEEAQQSGDNLARLRQQLAALEHTIKQGNERLLILPPDRLPGVIVALREQERERDAARAELHRAESHSPVRHLESQIAEAEAVLWRLEEALQAEDAAMLREAIRVAVSRVTLYWTHEEHGKRIVSRFSHGEIVPQTSEDSEELSPSAGRSHCSHSRGGHAHTDRRPPGWHKHPSNLPTVAWPGTRSARHHRAVGTPPGSSPARQAGHRRVFAKGKRRSTAGVACRRAGGGCVVHRLHLQACRWAGRPASRSCPRPGSRRPRCAGPRLRP